MKEIQVKTNTPYSVIIGKDILSSTVKRQADRLGKRALIVTDTGVPKDIWNTVETALSEQGKKVFVHIVPAGESSKNKHCLFEILERLAELGFTRSDCVFAVGGGMVGDLAGLSASLYARGIDYVQIPTTLLSAVDSSVGGKTAVNLSKGKNLVGAFYQPKAVVCDVNFMNTLDEGALTCGYAEMIKCAFLQGGALFDLLEKRGKGYVEKAIELCVEYKARIVSEDEREGGNRRLLNLGHTIGHAVERAENFTLSHGVCVGIGLYKILQISRDKGMISADYNRAYDLICAYKLPCDYTLTEKVKEQILLDKKADGGGVDMVLLKAIGKPYIQRISFEELWGIL